MTPLHKIHNMVEYRDSDKFQFTLKTLKSLVSLNSDRIITDDKILDGGSKHMIVTTRKS